MPGTTKPDLRAIHSCLFLSIFGTLMLNIYSPTQQIQLFSPMLLPWLLPSTQNYHYLKISTSASHGHKMSTSFSTERTRDHLKFTYLPEGSSLGGLTKGLWWSFHSCTRNKARLAVVTASVTLPNTLELR